MLGEWRELELVEVSLVAKPMQALARVHAVEGDKKAVNKTKMKLAWIGVLAALGGCDGIELAKQEPPAVVNGIDVAYGTDIEKAIRGSPGMTKACANAIRRGGIDAFPEVTEDCFEMTEPRRWRGLFRAEFEGWQFCPEPDSVCDPFAKPYYWLTGFDDVPRDGALYRVEFMGRRTVFPGSFGQMGVAEHEFVVDRPISIQKVMNDRWRRKASE